MEPNDSLDLFKKDLHAQLSSYPEILPFLHEGKYLRPQLAFLSRDLCQVSLNSVRNFAVSVECIHLASLFHDDVMDNALLRRKQPALHKQYGTHQAILWGNQLLCHALGCLLKEQNFPLLNVFQNTLHHLIEGQKWDGQMKLEWPFLKVLNVMAKKTGSLLSFALTGPALLVSSFMDHALLFQVGHHWGIAFQVWDDVNDYLEGTKLEDGGQDFSQRKISFPLWLSYQNARPEEKEIFQRRWYQDPSLQFREVKEWIETYHGFRQSQAWAQQLFQKGKEILEKKWGIDRVKNIFLKNHFNNIFYKKF